LHPEAGSSDEPLPDPTTTLRPPPAGCFDAPSSSPLTQTGFALERPRRQSYVRLPSMAAGLLDRSRPLEPWHDAWRFHRGRSPLDEHRRRDARRPVQPRRTARVGWVPRRLQRSHPRCLHARPAPVRRLVRRTPRGGVSGCVAPTSNASPPPRGARPSPGHDRGPTVDVSCSTATPNRNASSRSRRPRTCGDPAWTTSPMPPAWTAMRSAPCWTPPDSPAHVITP
jgi:hypothetical protein